MPAFIAALDELPLLPNGKIDRQALQAIPVDAGARPIRGGLEELILALWTERLPSPPTSLDSDFHLLGGDSLALVEFLIEVGDILGRSISTTDMPQPLTVAAMARSLGEMVLAADVAVDVLKMSGEHRSQVLALLAESFSIREPMAAALHAQPDDLMPFANALLAHCESEPFSYVAIERPRRVTGLSHARSH